MPEPPALEKSRPEDQPVQFGLRTLFVLQAICAMFSVLFRYLGIFVLAIGMAATLIYQWIPAKPEHWRLKRFMVDFLGGILLPVFCMAYDPFVFVEGGPLSILAWLAVVLQMAIFLAWLLSGRRLRRAGSFFAGAMSGGAGIALLIQLPLLPIALLGLFLGAGVGIVGFTPTLTCVVFSRNAQSAWRLGKLADGPKASRHFWLGLLVTLLVPLALYAACGQWLPQVIQWFPRSTTGQRGFRM
jgi:hypothetical protein